jgi:DnaJ-class molecular chaperone
MTKVCPRCEGVGSTPALPVCPRCKGRGIVTD